MTTLERKGKINIQISLDPFLVFIVTSVLIHGLGLVILALSNRSISTARQETESTPIDFVVIPPEKSLEKPPPDTERRAINNSVAKGNVNPQLPSANDKIGLESELPKKPQSTISSSSSTPVQEGTSSREIEKATPQRDLPPLATNLPPKEPSLEPFSDSTEPSSIPETSSEQENPINSDSASLLGGTYRRTISEDLAGSFFNAQANASQQALNPSGLDARQDLDLGPYFEEIRRRVRRNWRPSAPNNNRHTVLAFSIQRNGQITGLKVIQTSGSEKIDRESLEAVQKSGPFSALPENFPQEQLDIQFNFNIYVHQGVLTPQLENWQRF